MTDIRIGLKRRDGERLTCIAVVERFGTKSSYRGPPIQTLLLKDIVDCNSSKLLTTHLWFTCGKWSEKLKVGDTFQFDARVSMYEKGYRGRREDIMDKLIQLDWRLERPTKVKVIDKLRKRKNED
jgi:hypothetical protein